MKRMNGLAFALVLGIANAGAAVAAPLDFPGTNLGAIPDNDPLNGRTIGFAATGIVAPVGRVALSITLSHTWVGDLSAVLTSPGGVAHMVVFARVGALRGSTNGDSSNLAGTYVFSDGASSDLWAQASLIDDNTVVAPGTYFPSSAGAPGRSDAGGCPTSMTGVFEGLSGSEANGNWTLKITDSPATDTGTVTAAVLTIDQSDTIFADNFESVGTNGGPGPAGAAIATHCINKVQADFTGDGLTDFVTSRNVGSVITWTVRENLGDGTAGPPVSFDLGDPNTDYIDTMDLDGDRIADAVVWNESAGVFRVRRSSRTTAAVVAIALGQTGDDSINSGDYTGDQRDDLAVFRAPPFGDPAGPTVMLVRDSTNGSIHSVSLGNGVDGDQFVNGGFDFDGDGLADILIQRADPDIAGGALFTLYNGRTGATMSTFPFGKASDFVVPGNHSGTPLFDTTTVRPETIDGIPGRSWNTRDTATGMVQPTVRFGIVGDQRLGGDYDGDGVSDVAGWRASATPGASQFQVRPSLDTATTWTIVQGEMGDFAVASSKVK